MRRPLGRGCLSSLVIFTATISGLPSPLNMLGMKSRHGYVDKWKDRLSIVIIVGVLRKSLSGTDESCFCSGRARRCIGGEAANISVMIRITITSIGSTEGYAPSS